jgi:Phosphodiester glycosidase
MSSPRRAYRPPAPPKPKRFAKAVYWRRRIILVVSIVVVVILGYLGVTLAMALGNPSYGVSASARIAEWGRDHGLGGIVNWAEAEYYKTHPPKKGGRPPLKAFGSGPTEFKIPAGGHLPPPVDMVSPAKRPLPGEGVWHVAGRRTATGIPTMYEAFVRPNAVNTSYVVGVAWMDPTLLSTQLYSGQYIPGPGVYKYSAPITPDASKTLVAAFNAGFRMQDAKGGYYTDGRIIDPLRVGAASVVIFKDGTMTVGQWGRDVTMTNQVASVRQNLDLIVDNSKPVPGLSNNDYSQWGITLGGALNVWRSGLGVTKTGAIVYVGGPSMSITDLANVLVLAGAVRGMELDINTGWVQLASYNGKLNTPITGANGTNLLSDMPYQPERFFATWETRDFFTMSLRPSDLIAPKKAAKKKA